jgi:hypothetical protein
MVQMGIIDARSNCGIGQLGSWILQKHDIVDTSIIQNPSNLNVTKSLLATLYNGTKRLCEVSENVII